MSTWPPPPGDGVLSLSFQSTGITLGSILEPRSLRWAATSLLPPCGVTICIDSKVSMSMSQSSTTQHHMTVYCNWHRPASWSHKGVHIAGQGTSTGSTGEVGEMKRGSQEHPVQISSHEEDMQR